MSEYLGPLASWPAIYFELCAKNFSPWFLGSSNAQMQEILAEIDLITVFEIFFESGGLSQNNFVY